jgi:hypothetical protein
VAIVLAGFTKVLYCSILKFAYVGTHIFVFAKHQGDLFFLNFDTGDYFSEYFHSSNSNNVTYI